MHVKNIFFDGGEFSQVYSAPMSLFEISWLFASTIPEPAPIWLPSVAFAISWMGIAIMELFSSTHDDTVPMNFRTLWMKAFVLRISIVVSTLIHELGHLITAVFTSQLKFSEIFTVGNLKGNIGIDKWLMALIPFLPWPKEASSPHVILPQIESHAIVRLAAPLLSLLFAAICTSLTFCETFSEISGPFAIGTWMVALGGISSDMLSTSFENNIYCCGNFGMLVICAMDK
jgi:hypothetical protein